MSGSSLLVGIFLIFVALPAAVTLLMPMRWFPMWLGLLTLFVLWMWSNSFDGPGGVFAYFGVMIVSVLNGAVVVARALKIAFDLYRENDR